MQETVMLRSTKDMQEFSIGATDGRIGEIRDFYFDDRAWVVRYLVVDTGTWLSSRLVLISPIALGRPSWVDKTLPVALTQAQVKDSPDIDTRRPVSRQQEVELMGHYGYPSYWGGMGLWGGGMVPYAMLPGDAGLGLEDAVRSSAAADAAQAEAGRQSDDNPHLRSCSEVTGYTLGARDGEIGQVQGFLVDEDTWALRYLVVSTSKWWLGHDVLIAPQWTQGVNWAEKTVSVDMTRQAVKDAPHYDPTMPLSRQHEMAVYKHHGGRGYWEDEGRGKAAFP